MMKQALLVIDVQNDYFAGGKMVLEHPDLALEKINDLETFFLKEKLPVIYIQHLKRQKNANFFEIGTAGAALHDKLLCSKNSVIIEKQSPNSFFETELLATLKKLNVEQLVICGMMTAMCIDSTTRAAKEYGFSPILIEDGTATKSLENDGRVIPARLVQDSFIASLKNFATVQSAFVFLKASAHVSLKMSPILSKNKS
ncbi:MAG: cysteine hydrolase family protein [Lactococcus hircilactis]